MKKQVVQVMLVGGRQAPNVIGAMILEPSRVELIVSRDEVSKAEPLLETLGTIEGINRPGADESALVSAHDYDANLAALETIHAKHPGATFQYNLTAGTKIMAFAAYDFAKRSHGQAFYINTAQREVVWLMGNPQRSTPIRMTIDSYLSTYGRQPVRTFAFEKLTFSQAEATAAARALAQAGVAARSLLYAVRKAQGSGTHAVALDRLESETQQLARELVRMKVVDGHSASVTVRSNHDWNFFKGDWLEVYAWDEAVRLSLFEECAFSLAIPSGSAKKEVDLACMYQAQLIHGSCKTDQDPFSTAYLDEIAAVSSLIGGRFCTRLFITNGVLTDSQRGQQFLAQAKQREIVVVTGDQLSDLGIILKEQAQKPAYQRM